MPFIRNLWVATLTSDVSDSGTEGGRVVIMNQNQVDVVHRELEYSADTGGGTLHQVPLSDLGILPDNYYLRIGIRGDDAWRPKMVVAWCERFTTGNVVVLGYDENITQVLSADASEGHISLPLRQIGRGNIRTGINRVMLVTGTGSDLGDLDWSTDSPVHVRITRDDASVVVNHTIRDTSQDDFEGAEGNVHYLPVISSFTRSQLTDASIELSIEDDDAWRPIVVVLFGLDTATGQPNEIVPLAHIHPWQLGFLSTDMDEGAAAVILPLAPMDP